MILNKTFMESFDFDLQLPDKPIEGTTALKINLLANIEAAYADKIDPQSTMVLLFDKQGNPLKKIIYSIQHASKYISPSYLNPGENITLVSFSADKDKVCIDEEQVIFTASILGDYEELSWNFGQDATPQTASGIGPVSVSYSSVGPKTVSLTLLNEGATLIESKEDFIVGRTCVREPFPGTPIAIPGIVKAVDFYKGGQDVAYNDSDVENQGALRDPTVPRADESVDTENGGEGLGNIGYTANGELVKYFVNIEKTGNYKITARIASQPGGGAMRLSINDVDKTGVIPVPTTGNWGTYQDLVINNVMLDAGENATLKFEVVQSGFNIASFSFEEQQLTGIVINRIFNMTDDPSGSADAVELLVTKDHLDIRGLIIKDFEDNISRDAGGKYQFNDNDLWSDLRIGTTIVLRRLTSDIAGYSEDLDPGDSKLDLLFENAEYLTTVSVDGHRFNLTMTDMVMLKTGSPEGVENAVHTFASNNGGGAAFFTSVTGPKLVSPATNGTGFFQYPLNPDQSESDYDGIKATSSSDGNRNWGDGFGTANITYINALRQSIIEVTPDPAAIVVNRVYNGSNDGNGIFDAVELLVIEDHLDIRGYVIKDFDGNITNDNGGKYRFNDIPFWQDLRSGTTIVLRKISGGEEYVQDLNAKDFTIDLLFENTDYITTAGSNNFNITQFDMVMIKTGDAAGVSGSIHAFATRGGGSNGIPSALFISVQGPKLVSENLNAGGAPSSFHYPLNPEIALDDFDGLKGSVSQSTARNWGFGFGENNIQFIKSLRDAIPVIVPQPSIMVSRTDNTNTGLDNNTLALGYGAQQLTLTATDDNSETGATTFSWSPADGLSNAETANPIFTPTASGIFVFTVTATNEFGKNADASVTITVIDVRCGNNNNKVLICLKTKSKTNPFQQICINKEDVENHLRKGNSLGTCESAGAVAANNMMALETNQITVYPSPFSVHTNVKFSTIADEPTLSIDLYSLNGIKIKNVFSGSAKASQEYSVEFNGANIPAGVYFFRLTGSKTVVNQKVILTQ